jgi:hypothetical protein
VRFTTDWRYAIPLTTTFILYTLVFTDATLFAVKYD